MILPGRFVPLADQFGMISDLGRIVLAQAVETLAAWRSERALADLRISVNVGVQQFFGDDFAPFIARLLDGCGIAGEKLTLEMTESVMAKDQALVARRMRELKQLGIRLSLDDFGSGRSSLASVKELPIDEVKIDGAFIADIETADSDRALIRTILAMARMLGLTSVAEHVENIKQEAFLRAYGCDCLQGFLYSRPLQLDQFRAHVLARRADIIAFPGIRQKA